MKKPEPWNKNNETAPVQTPAARPEPTPVSTSAAAVPGMRPWKTWLALTAIVIATVADLYAIWSLIFIYWIWLSIKNKELFFVERVGQKDFPITYWTTIVCWLVISVLGTLYTIEQLS